VGTTPSNDTPAMPTAAPPGTDTSSDCAAPMATIRPPSRVAKVRSTSVRAVSNASSSRSGVSPKGSWAARQNASTSSAAIGAIGVISAVTGRSRR
jgi:hypothetical protein